MVIYYADQQRTYFTWADGGLKVCVAYYNHITGIVSGASVVDTLINGDGHRTPAMLIDASGYIYVFYGSHGDPTKVKRTTYPGDISSWTTMTDIAGVTTYPQPHQLVSGAIVVFHRISDNSMAISKTTDQGATWSSTVSVVAQDANKWVYSISVSEDGAYPRKVHVAWTVLDSVAQARKHIWYARSDDGGTSWVRSDGTSLTLPIAAMTGAEKVFDSGTDQVNTQDIQLTSVGEPLILVSHGANGGENAYLGGAWHFKLVKKKSGSWMSYSVTDGDHQFDNGALVVVSDSDIRAIIPTAASQANSDGGNIEEWRSTDLGETWVKIGQLTNDALSHNGVKSARNSQPGLRAIWSYGDSTAASGVSLRALSNGAVRKLGPGDIRLL